MGFAEAVNSVLKENYSNFDGRARRSEYWYFALFTFLINMVLSTLSGIFTGLSGSGDGMNIGVIIIGVIALVVGIGLLLPSLAVNVRRLHDIGKSGWWLLIGFIPFVGGIVLFIFSLMDSQPGENMYGPNPKGM